MAKNQNQTDQNGEQVIKGLQDQIAELHQELESANATIERAGNNVGVESRGVDAVFIDRPVMLLLSLFPAHEKPEDATFLAAAGREYLIRSEQKGA